MGFIIALLLTLIYLIANPTVVHQYIPVVTSPDILYVRDGSSWGRGLPWGSKPWGSKPHHPPPPSPPSPPSAPLPPPPPGAAPPAPQPMGFLDLSKHLESFANCPWQN